jgi:hypothetical protein
MSVGREIEITNLYVGNTKVTAISMLKVKVKFNIEKATKVQR